MGGKAGEARHKAREIVSMYQVNQEHYGGQNKTKVCAPVNETNNRRKHIYGSGQPNPIIYMGRCRVHSSPGYEK